MGFKNLVLVRYEDSVSQPLVRRLTGSARQDQ